MTVGAANRRVVDGAAEIISTRLKVDAVDGAQGAVEDPLVQRGVGGSDLERVDRDVSVHGDRVVCAGWDNADVEGQAVSSIVGPIGIA